MIAPAARRLAAALAVAICTSTTPASGAVVSLPRPTDDADRAQSYFLGIPGTTSLGDLHRSSFRFADGVRGRQVAHDRDPADPGPPETLASRDDYGPWLAYCGPTAIALVTALDATPLLSSGKDFIFTRYRVRIVDAIKAPAGLRAGDEITVMRAGGEIVDAGEPLRAVFNRLAPYEIGATYFVELDRPPAFATRDFVAGETSIKYRDEGQRITTRDGWASGTYDALKRNLHRVVAASPCPVPGGNPPSIGPEVR